MHVRNSLCCGIGNLISLVDFSSIAGRRYVVVLVLNLGFIKFGVLNGAGVVPS